MIETDAERPQQPEKEDLVWYLGWEAGYDWQHEYYTGEGYVAYKGGCDLGAPKVSAGTWEGLLEEIEVEELP